MDPSRAGRFGCHLFHDTVKSAQLGAEHTLVILLAISLQLPLCVAGHRISRTVALTTWIVTKILI